MKSTNNTHALIGTRTESKIVLVMLPAWDEETSGEETSGKWFSQYLAPSNPLLYASSKASWHPSHGGGSVT